MKILAAKRERRHQEEREIKPLKEPQRIPVKEPAKRERIRPLQPA